LLGLQPGAVRSVEAITAAQPPDSRIEYANAVAETLQTGEPLVLTHAQHRVDDGVLRLLTTVTRVRHDGSGAPVRMEGCFVDVTDHLHYTQVAGGVTSVGLVECGSDVVALVTGEFDAAEHAALADALREAVDLGDTDGDVFVDARHLRYCDAHTIGILDHTAQALSGKRRLVVLHPPRIMRRLLSVAGLGDRELALVVQSTAGVPDGG
jgi:anti-anti-sigma regulatory factor